MGQSSAVDALSGDKPPLVDPNKPTAVPATRIFLELNRHGLAGTNEEVLRFTVQVAAEKMGLESIAAWLQTHSTTP